MNQELFYEIAYPAGRQENGLLKCDYHPTGPEFHSRTVLEGFYYTGRQDGACCELRAVMLGDWDKAAQESESERYRVHRTG